jgi:hypothetical protein
MDKYKVIILSLAAFTFGIFINQPIPQEILIKTPINEIKEIDVNIIYGQSLKTGNGYGWFIRADLPLYKIRILDEFLNSSNDTKYNNSFILNDGTDDNLIAFLKIYSYYIKDSYNYNRKNYQINMLLRHESGEVFTNETHMIWPWAARNYM